MTRPHPAGRAVPRPAAGSFRRRCRRLRWPDRCRPHRGPGDQPARRCPRPPGGAARRGAWRGGRRRRGESAGPGPARRRPAGHGHLPGVRGPRRRPALLMARTTVAEFPAWETLPHERLTPRSDTVGAAWPCCAGWPTPAGRAAAGPWPSSSPRSAPCCSPWSAGLGDLAPVRLCAGDDPASRRSSRPRRGRLHPHGHGRAPRRVRRPRRHPRRLPAHRGPPGARRVLGRHGRGDALVLRRRPALARGRGEHGRVGPALPRDAAHRRRPRAGPAALATGCPGSRTCWARSPRASPSRAWSRWPRRSSTGWSRSSTCCPTARPRPRRPREGPHPRPRPGGHERGVPRRLLGERLAGGTPGGHRHLAAAPDRSRRPRPGRGSPPRVRAHALGRIRLVVAHLPDGRRRAATPSAPRCASRARGARGYRGETR